MKKLLPIILILISAALAVASFILLPETVTTQISIGGSGATHMPKLIAVLLPTGLGIGGAIGMLASDDSGAKSKAMLVSLVGLLVFGIMLVVNL